jgi:hypothetical protein
MQSRMHYTGVHTRYTPTITHSCPHPIRIAPALTIMDASPHA